MREFTALWNWQDCKAMSSRCRPAATRAAIFPRCSPAAITSPAWSSRIALGHGYTASGVARHVHRLVHRFQDIRDTAKLLAELNDAFTLSNEKSASPLRLTTVVTGTFDGTSGEFNFAYAAHPRMFLWREREKRFLELGERAGGLPAGIHYW